MRKLLLPAAAVAALLAALPMTTAAATPSASAAPHHVLTTGRVGGPNVKVGAVLKASLKSKTVATFKSGPTVVTCKVVMFSDTVTVNPSKPGTAVEKLTSQTFKKCSVKRSSVATGVKSVTLNGLPYRTTISDSRGNPVTVFGTKTTLALKSSLGTVFCHYKASKTKGAATNTSQTISFVKQPFTRVNSPHECPAKGSFSATFGPVRDTSLKGSPHVFVN